MRHVVPCLLLLALLLPAVPARAEDEAGDVGRLEHRVEMLLDLVAELRAEVLTLRERVEKLEAALADRGAVAAAEKVERIPAVRIEPVPIVVFPDVSGIYHLDAEASVKAITEAQLEGVEDEEMAEMIRATVAAELAEVTMTLRMEAGGTFFVRVEPTNEEEETTTARGTWTRDESVIGEYQRLLLVTTHENGEEESSPKELEARWQDGRLTIREGDADADGYVMVFQRSTAPVPARAGGD